MHALFSFEYDGHRLELLGSLWSGLEELRVDGVPVSRRRSFRMAGSHAFESRDGQVFRLDFRINVMAATVSYSLLRNDTAVASATLPVSMPRWADRLEPARPPAAAVEAATTPAPGSAAASGNRPGGHAISIGGLLVKALQSSKAIKIGLAGMAFSGWSVMFSWQFALVLIAVLMFHEYGHVRAMQRCGIKTRGIYLIPFVGGVAIGDKSRSHWQDVYIAMMGPVFGLVMSAVFYAIFVMTGNHYAGLVASVSALLNIVNLLPVHPLDGGRVVGAMVMSGGRSATGLYVLLGISAVCFAVAWLAGWYLLCFFVFIGVLDIVASWRRNAAAEKLPMLRYGIVVSLAWYLITIALFLALIYLIAGSGLAGSEMAVKVLES